MNLMNIEKQTTHPYIKKLGLNAVPFKHELIDPWRENFKGVEYVIEDLRLLRMVVDDVWINLDTMSLLLLIISLHPRK